MADAFENRAVEVAPVEIRGPDIDPPDMRAEDNPPPDIRGADAPAEPRGPAIATEAARQIAAIKPKRGIFAFMSVGFVKLDTLKPRELRTFTCPP